MSPPHRGSDVVLVERPVLNGTSSHKVMRSMPNGSANLPNPHLPAIQSDFLYHLAISTETHDLPKLFGDVKFVCMGGQASRMARLARFFSHELGHDLAEDEEPENHAKGTDRYALYKAGPVLFASHGIGVPSLSVVINEVFKLLYHARCKDVTFIRIGTCGGIGLKPGTVVVTQAALNQHLEPMHRAFVLGKELERPAMVNQELVQAIYRCAEATDEFETVLGKTMCTDDFYEGQGRLDGAICEFREEEKMRYLRELSSQGITNVEMESLGFYAFCHKAGFKAAVVCVTLLDRLLGDEPPNDPAALQEWQRRPLILVARYIKQQLGLKDPDMVQ